MIRRRFTSALLMIGLLLLNSLSESYAQKASYPVGYFGFPINPGQRNFLSGGMGDLRANHFHAGIDIKTQQREGLPVYAAAEGYVSRIAVMTGGYGNVIFIQHPTGFTTVYGHLLNFNEAIGNYVRQQQYAKQTFEIDLRPQPNELPIKKLELIGLSGNTGGSGGPHLHFEIRDSKDNILNPLNFGFGEVKDEIPPVIEGLAIKTMGIDARIEGEYGRKVYALQYKKGEGYVINQPIEAKGSIGLELLCYDKTTGSDNRNGVTCIEVEMDGKPIWNHTIEMFPNDWTRDYNVHVNYEIEKLTGKRWNRCYLIDGNRMPFYENLPSKGRINIADNALHTIRIKVWDVYQNLSFLTFQIQGAGNEPVATLVGASKFPMAIVTQVDENSLVVSAKNVNSSSPVGFAYFKRNRQEMPLAYIKNNEAVFLMDLRKGLPDSVQINNLIVKTYFNYVIPPGIQKRLKEANFSVEVGANSLFDTLYLNVQDKGNGFVMGNYTIPLRDYLTVSYKPSRQPDLKAKTFMYLQNGSRPRFLGGTWKGDVIEFKTRELGNFVLLTDTVPPRARISTKNKSAFSAIVSDDLSDIGTWRATVNGQWVLMNYDYKRDLIWSERQDTTQLFDGDLRLEVQDGAGNTTVLEDDFAEPLVPLAAKKKNVKTHPAKSHKKKKR